MNSLAQKFFQTDSNFEKVRVLSEEPEARWEQFAEELTDLPRGWFELSRISPRDRIDFIRDFWLHRIPFHPSIRSIVSEFFDRLDDIAVVLRKEKEEDLWNAELVYSLRDNSCFFRGLPPPTEQDIAELRGEMGVHFPRDYLAFIHIHNGFGKLSELGVLKIEEIPDARRRVMELVLQAEKTVQFGNAAVDAGSLIPFFEAYGLASFQCFYADWYPGSEMGNVYLSGIDYTLSGANETFLEWLAQYLQGVNLSL